MPPIAGAFRTQKSIATSCGKAGTASVGLPRKRSRPGQKIIDAIFAEANELKQKLEGKSKQHEPFSF
jgi:hypothetical protein